MRMYFVCYKIRSHQMGHHHMNLVQDVQQTNSDLGYKHISSGHSTTRFKYNASRSHCQTPFTMMLSNNDTRAVGKEDATTGDVLDRGTPLRPQATRTPETHARPRCRNFCSRSRVGSHRSPSPESQSRQQSALAVGTAPKGLYATTITRAVRRTSSIGRTEAELAREYAVMLRRVLRPINCPR